MYCDIQLKCKSVIKIVFFLINLKNNCNSYIFIFIWSFIPLQLLISEALQIHPYFPDENLSFTGGFACLAER